MEITRIPTQKEYESNELNRALAKLEELEAEPASAQKEAFIELTQRDITQTSGHISAIVPQRLRWLLDGSYGYGEMRLAQLALAARNPNPGLFRLVCAFEWQIKSYYASKAYKLLRQDQRDELNAAFAEVIAEYKAEQQRNVEFEASNAHNTDTEIEKEATT